MDAKFIYGDNKALQAVPAVFWNSYYVNELLFAKHDETTNKCPKYYERKKKKKKRFGEFSLDIFSLQLWPMLNWKSPCMISIHLNWQQNMR